MERNSVVKGDRRNNEQETCPISRKKYWDRILRCERTKVWKHQIFTRGLGMLVHKEVLGRQ
jgi:hypothetical protein